jgi:subtilase family serine protease
MRGIHCWLLLVILAGLWIPHSALGQTTGYAVTEILNPELPPPPAWWRYDESPTLNEADGLVRGADGYLYAIRHNYDGVTAISRVSPTTGTTQLLYVIGHVGGYGSYFFRGREGRLYFTMRDQAFLLYDASRSDLPRDNQMCGSGCVLYIDTADNAALRTLWSSESAPGGDYLDWGVVLEDTEGKVYVNPEEAQCQNEWDWALWALLQIDPYVYGDVTEYHDPESCPNDSYFFDWSTVTSSGNDKWRWTDSMEYLSSGQDIYQRDPITNNTTLLARIAVSDGQLTKRGDHPHGLAEASGYLYGITRRGGALNGGVVFRIRVPGLASPDLVITHLSDPPPTAAPGALFAVNDTTLNNGPEPAALSRNAYYLSRDGTHGDIRLVNGRYLPELWPGEESSGARSVKIPATTATGVYWLMACADTDSQVAESNDANNCSAAAAQITVGYPDLRQTGVSTSAAYASPGGKIGVSDTVDNPTIVTAPVSSTRFYLSLDLARNAGDVLLTGKRAVQELSSGEISTGPATLTLPSAVADGSYYLLACADDLRKIKEASETNNCAASSTTLLVGWADLVTTAVNDPPANVLKGSKFTILDTALNQGTIPAAATYMRYYLSGDGVKDGGDVLLMGSRSVGSLAAGASSPGNRLVTVPLWTPLGTYRVLACADDTSKVAENDNANNCRASAMTIAIE